MAQKANIKSKNLGILYFDLYFKTQRVKSHNLCAENLNTRKTIFALSFSFLGREIGPTWVELKVEE